MQTPCLRGRWLRWRNNDYEDTGSKFYGLLTDIKGTISRNIIKTRLVNIWTNYVPSVKAQAAPTIKKNFFKTIKRFYFSNVRSFTEQMGKIYLLIFHTFDNIFCSLDTAITILRSDVSCIIWWRFSYSLTRLLSLLHALVLIPYLIIRRRRSRRSRRTVVPRATLIRRTRTLSTSVVKKVRVL